MTEAPTTTDRSVVIERDLAYPPTRIWRALTQPHLIAEWLMQNDFMPVAGHAFKFRADWGSVECRVLEIEPDHALSYTWNTMGMESTVTWTLTPSPAGTRLRMEHAGFKPDQQQAYQGAKFGWAKFLASLEGVLARPA